MIHGRVILGVWPVNDYIAHLIHFSHGRDSCGEFIAWFSFFMPAFRRLPAQIGGAVLFRVCFQFLVCILGCSLTIGCFVYRYSWQGAPPTGLFLHIAPPLSEVVLPSGSSPGMAPPLLSPPGTGSENPKTFLRNPKGCVDSGAPLGYPLHVY